MRFFPYKCNCMIQGISRAILVRSTTFCTRTRVWEIQDANPCRNASIWDSGGFARAFQQNEVALWREPALNPEGFSGCSGTSIYIYIYIHTYRYCIYSEHAKFYSVSDSEDNVKLWSDWIRNVYDSFANIGKKLIYIKYIIYLRNLIYDA